MKSFDFDDYIIMATTSFFSGNVSLKDIFLCNDAWTTFKEKYPQYLTPHKIYTVEQMLACCTTKLGGHVYKCPDHGNVISVVPHTCKTSICNICGSLATEKWLANLGQYLLPCDYKDLNFTIPHDFNPFIRKNMKLFFSIILEASNHAIMSYGKEKGFIPGMFSVLQTFSKRKNFHLHTHHVMTAGGLSLDHSQWITEHFIDYNAVEQRFRFKFIELIRKQGNDPNSKIVYPKHYDAKRLLKVCRKTASLRWNNDVGKEPVENPLIVANYLGKYLHSSIISESKIQSFDGTTVTLMLTNYLTQTLEPVKFTQHEFIKLVIQHIPDKHSKSISYSGIFANRNKAKLLPIAKQLLTRANSSRANSVEMIARMALPNTALWRERITNYNKKDPLKCTICNKEMVLDRVIFPDNRHAQKAIEHILENPDNIIVYNPFAPKPKNNKYQKRVQRNRDHLWYQLKSGSIRN